VAIGRGKTLQVSDQQFDFYFTVNDAGTKLPRRLHFAAELAPRVHL
jgi:hypothetical protein